jgi:hypothetical protein
VPITRLVISCLQLYEQLWLHIREETASVVGAGYGHRYRPVHLVQYLLYQLFHSEMQLIGLDTSQLQSDGKDIAAAA